jgi:hypothetical protein
MRGQCELRTQPPSAHNYTISTDIGGSRLHCCVLKCRSWHSVQGFSAGFHMYVAIVNREPHNTVASSAANGYRATTTHPICSSHEDAFWAVDEHVSPSKPPQGGFAVS